MANTQVEEISSESIEFLKEIDVFETPSELKQRITLAELESFLVTSNTDISVEEISWLPYSKELDK